MTRVGAKRVRDRHIVVHAAVRVHPSVMTRHTQGTTSDSNKNKVDKHRTSNPEADAVRIALEAPTASPTSTSAATPTTVAGARKDSHESAKEGVRNTDAAHRYGKAVVAALSFCASQLGGVRLSERGAVRLLSAAWDDARGIAAAVTTSSSTTTTTTTGAAQVSRTLRVVLTVSGLESAAAARLLRAACVCVRTIAVPLDVFQPVTGLSFRARERQGSSVVRDANGVEGVWARTRIPHDVSLRVSRV